MDHTFPSSLTACLSFALLMMDAQPSVNIALLQLVNMAGMIQAGGQKLNISSK